MIEGMGFKAPWAISDERGRWIETLRSGQAILVNCPTELSNSQEPDELRLALFGNKVPLRLNHQDGIGPGGRCAR